MSCIETCVSTSQKDSSKTNLLISVALMRAVPAHVKTRLLDFEGI